MLSSNTYFTTSYHRNLIQEPGVTTNLARVKSAARHAMSYYKLGQLLMTNPLEAIVPFNLWFSCDSVNYQVVIMEQNQQLLRLRFYQNLLLTPTIAFDSNLLHLRQLDSMSLYQPIYPENFFTVWEFLQLGHLANRPIHVLDISLPDRLGRLEALILYLETYCDRYRENIYHSWIAKDEEFKLQRLQSRSPSVDILGQNYQLKSLTDARDFLVTYDLLSIDCINPLTDNYEWPDEQADLARSLFYLLDNLPRLKDSGSLLIRLNTIGNDCWQYLIEIIDIFFLEKTVYRPQISNAFSPEIYIFATHFNAALFQTKVKDGTIYYEFLRSLYINNVYSLFSLIYDPSKQNKTTARKMLSIKYNEIVNKWIEELHQVIGSLDEKPNETEPLLIKKWHVENNLLQIKDACQSTMIHYVPQLIIKTMRTRLIIKPIPCDVLTKQSFYQKLIGKRAELNYHKRIMDTKPSYVFNYSARSIRLPYITWEDIVDDINPYYRLRNQIRKRYRVEMVTNAWLKMFEILNSFPNLIPTNSDIVKSFHICEAPGAFIAATHHYLNQQKRQLDWYAQSLIRNNSEKYKCQPIVDVMGLMEAYPDRWIYGPEDSNGDITHARVIKAYENDSRLQNIQLMTADAGLQGKPNEFNEQESMMGRILLAEVTCILACLSKQGNAVLKLYLPMTEALTLSIVYILTCAFTSVTMTKPLSSGCTNSEIYLILIGFKGISKSVLNTLYELIEDPDLTSQTLLTDKFDREFLDTYAEHVATLIDLQTNWLRHHYYYYYNRNQLPFLQKDKKTVIDKWLNHNPIQNVDKYLLNMN